jgi:hypothetical protein
LERLKHYVETEFVELADEALGFKHGRPPVEVICAEVVVFSAIFERR